MSKVCYFLLTTFFILFFLAIRTAPAFAADDWKVIPDPENVTTETKQLSVTFTNLSRANFFTVPPYGAVVWRGDANGNNLNNNCRDVSSLPMTDLKLTFPDNDTQTVIVAWNMSNTRKSCLEPDTHWYMRLVAGDVSQFVNTNSSLQDYTFNIVSPNGKAVTIGPVEQPPTIPTIFRDDPQNNPPQIYVYNATPDQKYFFWWKDQQIVSAKYPVNAISNDPIPIVQLPKFNFNDLTENGKNVKQKRLCFEYGEPLPGDRVPLFNSSCSMAGRFIDFAVNSTNPRPVLPSPTPGQPPPTTKPTGICDLYAAHLEEVAETDTVIVGYKEALPNQEFTATLQPDGGPSDRKGKSNENGRILIKVADRLKVNSYTISIVDSNNQPICTKSFSVTKAGSSPAPAAPCDKTAECTFSGNDSTCDTNDSRGPGIRTAVGCIHTSPPELVKDVMTFMLGISGGLAFLMMLLGAFQMLTSAGNPETLHAGRERLTSAIIGLLIVIFATLLLQIIGVDILKIPGFG